MPVRPKPVPKPVQKAGALAQSRDLAEAERLRLQVWEVLRAALPQMPIDSPGRASDSNPREAVPEPDASETRAEAPRRFHSSGLKAAVPKSL